jgi:hypothetical protein
MGRYGGGDGRGGGGLMKVLRDRPNAYGR